MSKDDKGVMAKYADFGTNEELKEDLLENGYPEDVVDAYINLVEATDAKNHLIAISLAASLMATAFAGSYYSNPRNRKEKDELKSMIVRQVKEM